MIAKVIGYSKAPSPLFFAASVHEDIIGRQEFHEEAAILGCGGKANGGDHRPATPLIQRAGISREDCSPATIPQSAGHF